MAGAIIAALFLQRFVTGSTPWLHLDTYAWNDSTRPVGTPKAVKPKQYGPRSMQSQNLFMFRQGSNPISNVIGI